MRRRQQQNQERRPDQIKLFFNAQRPHMQERMQQRDFVEIVDRGIEMDIGDARERSERRPSQRLEIGWRQYTPARRQADRDRDGQGGKQAAKAGKIKRKKFEIARAGLEDLTGDKIAGDDEEHINTNKSAGHPG